MSQVEIREMLLLLGLERGGSKAEAATRLLEFLECPAEKGKARAPHKKGPQQPAPPAPSLVNTAR